MFQEDYTKESKLVRTPNKSGLLIIHSALIPSMDVIDEVRHLMIKSPFRRGSNRGTLKHISLWKTLPIQTTVLQL